MIRLNDNLGKIPPQAIDVEESILGTILSHQNAMTICIQYLRPEVFYKESNQKIYRAINELFDSNKNIDSLTVCENLRKSKELENCGGVIAISMLASNVPTSHFVNIENHCQIVLEKYIRRELIRISNETIIKAYEESEDAQDIIDNLGIATIGITNNLQLNSIEKIGDLIVKKVEEIEKICSGEIKIIGVPSNLRSLDIKTSGWQPTDLIILAARPSIGKTAFALKLSKEAAMSNFPTVIFSLEMSSSQLATRLLSGETDNTQMELKKGIVSDWKRIEKAVVKFNELPLYVDDKASLTISQLRSRLIIYKQKYGIKLAVIDYLQLISGTGNEKIREQVISNIARTLKITAKELEIPIIALSQLSRETEKRADKKPILSDLRESGAIEQDADLVLFLRRDEMYNDDADKKNKIQLDIAKHRHGSTDELELNYIVGMSEFYDAINNQNADGMWYNKDNEFSPY